MQRRRYAAVYRRTSAAGCRDTAAAGYATGWTPQGTTSIRLVLVCEWSSSARPLAPSSDRSGPTTISHGSSCAASRAQVAPFDACLTDQPARLNASHRVERTHGSECTTRISVGRAVGAGQQLASERAPDWARCKRS